MKLIATIYKEILLLTRDRAGLLVLFLMPAALVLVITLVQENIMKTTGETQIRTLFINNDQETIGNAIETYLKDLPSLEIVTHIDGHPIDPGQAKSRIHSGQFQVCVIVPKGFTQSVEQRVRWMMQRVFADWDPAASPSDGSMAPPKPEITLLFDPMVRSTFRSAVTNAIHLGMMTMEMEMKAKAISKIIPEQLNARIDEWMGFSDLGESSQMIPSMAPDWGKWRLMDVSEASSDDSKTEKLPTSVQQNVPAWALFGMFFIVVPLGGTIIREKQQGTLVRLMTLPVSYSVIIFGKILAYMLVCQIQFGIIFLLGKYFLPALGTPMLETGSSPLAIVAMVMAASLAASGYGVLVGTVARTYEQASMFGAVSVVIAAAIGGVMVPVYVMPDIMRQLSHISPLAWGLQGFTDIFVRGGGLNDIIPEIIRLIAFFTACLAISWMIFIRKSATGKDQQ